MQYNSSDRVIPFIKPHFPEVQKIVEDVSAIRESNIYTNFGPFEEKLCKEIESLYEHKVYVTTIANATLGLQASIECVLGRPVTGSNSPSYVIIPSFTFAAGAQVLLSLGYTPLLIDINSELQPDINEALYCIEKYGKHVKGILLCSSFGISNSEIVEWESLASDTNIPLMIDNAAGFGSRYSDGTLTGTHGECEVFSLHATKPFSAGEGGIVISKNEKLIDSIRAYQNFGFNSDREIFFNGTNAKMQEISCAIGLRQLDGLMRRIEGRQMVYRRYHDELKLYDVRGIANQDISSMCFASMILPTPSGQIVKKMNSNGVMARRYYRPLHTYDLFKRRCKKEGDLPTTTDVYDRIIALPVHDNMKDSSVQRVLAELKKSLNGD